MKRTRSGLAVTGAVLVAGCGSATHFADNPRPATPVDLTVYVNDARVSVSPARVGAGPVIFFVTNQASKTESVTIHGPGNQATTGPINPQSTAQVTVDFSAAGDYTISTSGPSSDSAVAAGDRITPATLHIGAARPNADNALLQP